MNLTNAPEHALSALNMAVEGIHHLSTPARASLDVLAAASAIGSVMGHLPHATAAIGFVWYLVLLYDRFIKPKEPKE